MTNQIDLDGALGKRATISVDPEEGEAERDARLIREAGEARLELVKGYVLFFTTLGMMLMIAGLCVFYGFVDPTATPDTRKWAQTVLSSLFTGLVSFALGQRIAKK